MSEELSIVVPEQAREAVLGHWQLQALREDLLALDVERVGPLPAGPAPAHSRSGLAEAVGALVVVLQPTLPLLEVTLGLVRDWIGRVGARSVVLEIDGQRLEVTGVASAEQRRLAEAWLAAVTADRR
jgi:hypothetical protein